MPTSQELYVRIRALIVHVVLIIQYCTVLSEQYDYYSIPGPKTRAKCEAGTFLCSGGSGRDATTMRASLGKENSPAAVAGGAYCVSQALNLDVLFKVSSLFSSFR
jgi:hypothetical protein